MTVAAEPANAPVPASAESVQARDLLIRLLAVGLGSKFHSGRIPDSIWPAIVKLAADTKTAGLLAPACRKAGLELPQGVRQQLAEIQAENLRSNLANLSWTIKASQVLEEAGIPVLAFKGAIRVHEVYARWDARRSSDIDLLVDKGDYLKSCDILASAGFKPLVARSSAWWHRHLGEAPFARTDGSGAIVDLHNSLQQPGGPYPARLEDFWTHCVTKQFGNARLQTPSPQHSLLICAISYGKAVRSSSPWLAHGHELALSVSAMTDTEAQHMRGLAEEQGLLRLYDDALSSAKRLFSLAEPSVAASPASAAARDNLVLSAWGLGHKDRFSRTKRMWDWCDGDGVRRSATFTGAIWRICRRDVRQYVENLTGQNRLRIPAGD